MYSTCIELTGLKRVYSGVPCADGVLQEADRQDAQSVFLVVSGTLNRETNEIGKITNALGRRVSGVFYQVRPHVPREDLCAAAVEADAASPDLLVAVGGGSVVDLTKILSVCLKHGLKTPESLESYRMVVNEDKSVFDPVWDGPDIPIVAVPTTLSGGEFNALAGATDKIVNIKQGYQHPDMTPGAVVLDPRVTLHTPEWLWLSTGVRAIDHAFETLGSLDSNDYFDGMAMNAIRLLSEGLPVVQADGDDLRARQICQMGAWCSMSAIVSGRPMGISHAVGHALGGSFDVPHGYTSCVMAPYALEYNEPVNGDRQRLISTSFGQQDRPAHELADELIRSLGMPRCLRDVGLTADDLPKLAHFTFEDIWCDTNPRVIPDEDVLIEFLNRAL